MRVRNKAHDDYEKFLSSEVGRNLLGYRSYSFSNNCYKLCCLLCCLMMGLLAASGIGMVFGKDDEEVKYYANIAIIGSASGFALYFCCCIATFLCSCAERISLEQRKNRCHQYLDNYLYNSSFDNFGMFSQNTRDYAFPTMVPRFEELKEINSLVNKGHDDTKPILHPNDVDMNDEERQVLSM